MKKIEEPGKMAETILKLQEELEEAKKNGGGGGGGGDDAGGDAARKALEITREERDQYFEEVK